MFRLLVCEIIDGVQIIVDVTYYRNEFVNNVTNNLNIPYVKIDVSIGPILQFLDALLDIRNCTDVAIIFDKYFCKISKKKLENSLRLFFFLTFLF